MHADLQIARSLTWRYLVALVLIALLATSAWLSLVLVISEQQSSAAIVNISGRQRMLSQRTALFAAMLANAAQDQRPAIRTRLADAADLMQRSHRGLTQGSEEMGLPARMSDDVRRMYYEPPLALDAQLAAYLADLQQLLALPDAELHPQHPLLQRIIGTAPVRLVASLDQMVSQYQREGEASVGRLQRAETIVWLMTLLLLCLEAAFIFRPFARETRRVIGELQAATEHLRASQEALEVRVQERTQELEEKNRALVENEERLRLAASVFANSQDGVMITDASNQIIDVNPAFTRITGYSREEVVGQNPRILAAGRHSTGFYAEMWHAILEDNGWRGEVWNRRKNGDVYAELLEISVVRDTRGQVEHYIGVFSDISQIKNHAAELDHVAHFDTLTGIPNRRLLDDRLRQALMHARRRGKSLAVCYLDLDGFKPINDEFGQSCGDALLVEVALRLKQILRGEDTLARLGGDEFVLILAELEQAHSLHAILDRVMTEVAAPVYIAGNVVNVTASIGVTLYPADDADPDTLLRHADQAMFQAKQAGKNRFQLFDPEHDRLISTHRSQLRRLQEALAQGEFILYYQPKVDLLSGEVLGAEALIRWQHPERGLIPPAEFLPVIEGSDLEFAVGEWVLKSVVSQISGWHASGLRISVSANVSADHLLQPSFAERLQLLLEDYPETVAGALELEVLETAALADMDQAINTMTECRRLGVRFSLDDFGTGYSSLAYFRSLPVDVLKIDQSFVREMLADPDDLSLVESVTRLAHAFNREVIAEGVETLEHGAVLIGLGCHLAQGYGVARPMPAAQIPSWIAGWQESTPWRGIDHRHITSEELALVVAARSHRNWVDRIVEYVVSASAEAPQILDSARCRFGRWYRGSGAARYGHLAGFEDIAPCHESVHVIATGLVALTRDGQVEVARAGLPALLDARDHLLDQIETLVKQIDQGGGAG